MATSTLHDDHQGEQVADAVEDVVDEQPWVETVARFGWIAKGVVYALMGLTAFTIGRHRPTDDEASPEGAMAQVATTRGGQLLLAVLAVGLALYALWRLMSAALVRGGELRSWLDRVGYLFSAGFYALLALAAFRAVMQGDEPRDGNTVERLSSWMLNAPFGRWALFLAGLTTIGIGVYFIVDRGFRRSFRKDLDLSDAEPAERRALLWAGSVGWVSRGIITVAVGWFVVRAAWRAHEAEARGFDRAFRELATSGPGSLAVAIVGVTLIVYGIFCALIVRHLDLDKVS
jgi:hypothetical protein